MKSKLIACILVAMMAVSGCNKDLSADWAGTYDGTGGNNTVQRVIVSSVGKKAVKLELQSSYLGTYVTFATVGNAELSSATKATVDEDGSLYGSSDPYRFTGNATLSGTTLTITGIATNKNNGDTQGYYFVGNR